MAFVLALALGHDARAQHAPDASPPPPAVAPETLAKLASNDADQIRSALDDVRTAGTSGVAAVRSIVLLLQHGVVQALTEAAIATLADIESPAASEELAVYARHRSGRIRLAAVNALARTKGPSAIAALRVALSDPDPSIRQSAADGLGALHAQSALPELFLALDRRIPGVSASIGKMCLGPDCERLAEAIGVLPFEVVASGLTPMIFREDVSDDTKVSIVSKLRSARTADAAKFLREVQKGWPSAGSARVKEALDQAVTATRQR